MLQALANAFKIKDLRKKMLYTTLMLVVFRAGAFIPVPGIDASGLSSFLDDGGLFGFVNMFAGGAFGNMTIFALSVSPYITASIIVQLLTVVFPSLEEMAKEGVEGRQKLQQITRYSTVVLAVLQAFGISIMLRGNSLLLDPGFFSVSVIVLTLTAGSMFLMWLGEEITVNGIGNGISLIIFAGIMSRVPPSTIQLIKSIGAGGISIWNIALFLVLGVVVIAAVIMMQEGERRIPVQYSKRVRGRKVYGGQTTYIPLKVNMAGVMPVIFASALLAFPVTLMRFFPRLTPIFKYVDYGTPLYLIFYTLLIILFTYFYTAVQVNPMEIADNMKKYGGFIPGLRPGKPTAQYINRIMERITLVGAIFLAIIALLPNIIGALTNIRNIPLGGTGLLIVVGVALETLKQIEAQLLIRRYEGFIK